MKVKDIMTKKVITVKPELGIHKLAQVFVKKNISGAPVVDGKGKLKGLVLEEGLVYRDKKVHLPTFIAILTGFIALGGAKYEQEMKKITAKTVSGIMDKNPVVIFPDTGVEQVATMIIDDGIRYFLVMDNDKLAGVVTKKDIVRAIAKGKI